MRLILTTDDGIVISSTDVTREAWDMAFAPGAFDVWAKELLYPLKPGNYGFEDDATPEQVIHVSTKAAREARAAAIAELAYDPDSLDGA